MNIPGNFFNELSLGFEKMKYQSEFERKATHKLFAAFYNNDYLTINEILKKKTLKRETFACSSKLIVSFQ